jgi:hypothetical protein
MIIKPICRENYVPIPNALIYDRRLSIETRGMLVYLLAKPPKWVLTRYLLEIELARSGKRLGWKKVSRMITEAYEAGYVARSAEQMHHEDGSWGPFDYHVGMPEDVAAAVARAPDGTYSSIFHEAHAPEACARAGNAYKIKSQEKEIDIDSEESFPEGCRDALSAYGTAAQSKGLRFVRAETKPFHAWKIYTQANGGQPAVVILTEIIAGKSVNGAWLPSLYPPAASAIHETKSATGHQIAKPTAMSELAAGLIDQIMRVHGCSQDEAMRIFSELPDAK